MRGQNRAGDGADLALNNSLLFNKLELGCLIEESQSKDKYKKVLVALELLVVSDASVALALNLFYGLPLETFFSRKETQV